VRANAEKEAREKCEAQARLNTEMDAEREAARARHLAQQKAREAEDLKRLEQQLSEEGDRAVPSGQHIGEPNTSLLSGANNQSQFEIMEQPLQDFIEGRELAV